MGRVHRVPRAAGMQVGQLGRHGLAHDHGARRPQARHRRRVLARHPARVVRRAVARGHPRHVDDVLDPDGQAVERADRAARPARRV